MKNDSYFTNSILLGLRNIWLKKPLIFSFCIGLSSLLMILFMALALEYAYKPQMCVLCHEMKPAYDTWNSSFHGPVKGGANDCLGCHTAPGFGSKIKAKLGGMIFLWDHVIGNFEPDIKAKLPVYCIRSGCHIDPWKMDRGSKIRVNHALHISKGYGCVVCHDRIAHGSDPEGRNLPGMKDFCFPCHNDEIASRNKCEYCHIYQAEMLKGNGGEGIPQGDISVHKMVGLSCIDCHTEGCEPKPAQICLDCHNESEIGSYEEQKRWVLKSIKALEDGISRLKKTLDKSEEMGWDISQLNGIYNLITEVHRYINADGSKCSHNVNFTIFLLNDALNKLDYADLLIGRRKGL